jgi:hypothetical protein
MNQHHCHVLPCNHVCCHPIFQEHIQTLNIARYIRLRLICRLTTSIRQREPTLLVTLRSKQCKRREKFNMAPIFAPTVKLNNGFDIPVLGLGTWKVKVNYLKTPFN